MYWQFYCLRTRYILTWCWSTSQRPCTRWQGSTASRSRPSPSPSSSCTCINCSDPWLISTQMASVIATSSLRTSYWILTVGFSSSATLVVPNTSVTSTQSNSLILSTIQYFSARWTKRILYLLPILQVMPLFFFFLGGGLWGVEKTLFIYLVGWLFLGWSLKLFIFRAPELIFGATDYTTNIDVWSAGCVFAGEDCRAG